jgi:putative transposase
LKGAFFIIAILKSSNSERLMSMQNELPPLTAYSEKQRETAKEKYKVIAPYLQNEKTLTVITEETGIAKRTLQYWIRDYKQFGLKGLIRKTRSDAGKILSELEVVVSIEQLILKYKRNSLTSIHRMICEQCLKQGWQQPSY